MTGEGVEEGTMNNEVYKISTLKTIFELPTIEQMKTCLEEITESLIMARTAVDLSNLIAEKDGLPRLAFQFPESQDWVDDNKGDVGFVVKHENEEVFSMVKSMDINEEETK